MPRRPGMMKRRKQWGSPGDRSVGLMRRPIAPGGESVRRKPEWEEGRGERMGGDILGPMQPFVDIANYNRGVWAKPSPGECDWRGRGMSVRHGLSRRGTSPMAFTTWPGNAAEWVGIGTIVNIMRRAQKNPTGPAKGRRK